MKAVLYDRYGSPSQLRVADIEKPVPGPGEVLVRVQATSINAYDSELLRGTAFNRLSGAPIRPKFPILGGDVAGIVEAIGQGVERFKAGDEVYGDLTWCNLGGLAEFAVAEEGALAFKPLSMSFHQAAATAQAGSLAWQGVSAVGEMLPGERVLITGGGGGVGTFAIQMAKSLGAEVTGLDSAAKQETMRAVGADHTIDYERDDFTDGDTGYHKVIDISAYRAPGEVARVVEPGGAVVAMGGSTLRLLMAATLGGLVGRRHAITYKFMLYRRNPDDLNQLNRLFEAGAIAPTIDRVYPFEQAREAFRAFAQGDAKGKIVISVS